ncbi:hypothetical protein HMI55_004248 [Coelomomyces lativittatus]|nr:hypothetical protein HMI55_004248 [Coelomomyces lativittatus]
MHLTLEDGPTFLFPSYLDTLRSLQIKASIYICGHNVMQTINSSRIFGKESQWTNSSLASYIKRAYDEGHIIGSQTYSHLGLVNGTNEFNSSTSNSVELDVIRMQMLMNDILIYDIIGKYPLAFRPAYLEMNKTVLSILETMGYIPISANVDSKDFETEDSNILISNVMTDVNKTRSNGMIAIFHDGYDLTLEVLPQLLKQLKSQGIEFVDLPTCLNKSASAFYQSLATSGTKPIISSTKTSETTQTISTTSTARPATTTSSSATSQSSLSTSTSDNNITSLQAESTSSSLHKTKSYMIELLSIFLVTLGLI